MKKIFVLLLLVCSLGLARAQNIIKMEYWVDVDSGFGNGFNIPGFMQSPDISNFTFTIPASITLGIHVIGVRSKDINNVWSHSNMFPFYVTDTSNGIITILEYFWDTDPGHVTAPGADSILASPVADFNDILFASVPLNLPLGYHKLFIRSRDNRGRWSHTNYKIGLDSILITPPVGIGELQTLTGVTIYPNPVIDKITVTPKDKGRLHFILYDINGSCLIDKIIDQESQFDMKTFASGVYTIIVWTDKQKIYRSTIIKQ